MSHTNFAFPFKVKASVGATVRTSDLTNEHPHGMHFAFGSMQRVASRSNLFAAPSINCVIKLCHDRVCLLAWSGFK